MQMANQRAQEADQQREVENAMNRLAADRLEQYRQSEIANRKSELGLQERGFGLREQGLSIQQEAEKEAAKRGDETARHNLAMEQARIDADKSKNYGEPTYNPIPGIPGAVSAYRSGSPGMHVILPPRAQGQLSASQAASLMAKIPELQQIDPSITNELANLRSIAFPKSKSRFRYNRATGKLEEIAPLPQAASPTQTVTPDTTDEE